MDNFTIDRTNKSFVFDDGEVIPIPKDKEKQVLRSKAAQKSKQESIEKWQQWQDVVPLGESGHALVNSASENLFGNLGDTAANYVVSGIKGFSKGEGQNEMGYIDRVLDHFYAMQEGRKESLMGLQQNNPVASNIGKGLGIVGELGSLYGTPGALAFPLLGAGSSETSFLEPLDKAKEVGKDFITGKILDKFFGGLGKIAGNRENQRELKGIISSTEEANAAEIQRARQLNEAENLRFSNESAARNSELQNLPHLQQAENAAFQSANQAAAERISKTMGKNPLPAEILGVEDFIANSIETSSHAASAPANYAGRFLRSIFKGDKSGKINGASLQRGIKALDEAIIKSEGPAQELLIGYKNFLNQSLPERLASSYVFEKWMPKIVNSVDTLEGKLAKTLQSSAEIDGVLTKRLGDGYVRNLNNETKKIIEKTLSGYKNNFSGLDPSLIREEISDVIRSSPEYEKMMSRINKLFPQLSREQAFKAIPEFENIYKSVSQYPELLAERIGKNIEKYLPDMGLDFGTKGGVTSSAIQKAPVTPNILPQPAPVNPIQATNPNLLEVPIMPEPQGIYGKLAAGLESFRDSGPREMLRTAKQSAPTALLAKMAGVPLAKATAGIAGAATGLRALTSPSQAGKAFRGMLGQEGRSSISTIENLAEKYPSYRNGIIELPEHRRSLTREIENLPNVTLEEKAIFQSKINRGKPLHEKL